MEPPNYLDGAKVIKWTWSGLEPFGVIEILDSDEKEEIFGLAICKYDDSDNFYRFSCDKNWEVVQDSFYKSIEEAVTFLPGQYKNVGRNWLTK